MAAGWGVYGGTEAGGECDLRGGARCVGIPGSQRAAKEALGYAVLGLVGVRDDVRGVEAEDVREVRYALGEAVGQLGRYGVAELGAEEPLEVDWPEVARDDRRTDAKGELEVRAGERGEAFGNGRGCETGAGVDGLARGDRGE